MKITIEHWPRPISNNNSPKYLVKIEDIRNQLYKIKDKDRRINKVLNILNDILWRE